MRKLLFALLAIVAFAAVAKENASYVYHRGDGTSTIRSGGSLESILRIAKKWDGEFLWIRRGTREYLIRDAASLAELRAAFRELDALEPSHKQIAKKLRPLEKREQEIEEQLDAISDAEDEDERVDKARERELEKQMRAVEQKMRVVEDEMEALEKKMEALEEIAEMRLQEIANRAIRKGVAQRVD